MSLRLLALSILFIVTLSVFLRADVLSTIAPSLLKTWSYGTPIGNDVAVDSSGNITIVGGGGDALLLRYNATGSLLLQRVWGGNSQFCYTEATGGAVDASGNAYLTGRTSCYGNGNFQIFLLKFDPAGKLLWQETYGGSGYDGWGATVDSGGNVIITGDGVLLKFNSTGSLVWQDAWTGTGDSRFGRVLEGVAGDIYTFSATSLLKFNSTGSLIWARAWSGMTGGDISLDASGSIYLTGSGSSSIYLLRINQDGDLLWQNKWQTSGWTMTDAGLAANATGIIYVTADMTTCVPNPRGCTHYYEPLILEFNSTGSLIGELAIQGYGIRGLGRPSTDSAGSLYLVGTGTVAGASFCSPVGGPNTSSVSLTTATDQVLRPSYSVMPVSGVVGTPVGNETSQAGVILMKFDSGISGGSSACSAVVVFPLTLPMVTLMGIMIILQARRRLSRTPRARLT